MTLPQTHQNAVAMRNQVKQMAELLKAGMTATEIAEELDLTLSHVWYRLTQAGYDLAANSSNVWSMTDDDRRAEFAKRAARGAREALKGFSRGGESHP
jgi:orotate phosphoribosyltransferase-like protein